MLTPHVRFLVRDDHFGVIPEHFQQKFVHTARLIEFKLILIS